MKTTYHDNQIKQAEQGHDWTYKMTIQLHGTQNKSHFMDITKKQLEQIREILNQKED